MKLRPISQGTPESRKKASNCFGMDTIIIATLLSAMELFIGGDHNTGGVTHI